MAVKDHSYDEKIIESAKKEFLEHGFENASLRKIAENAGITTGALYTRYKSKDVLFSSLLKNIFDMIYMKSDSLNQNYQDAGASFSEQDILSAIKIEENVYIDLLKDHYDECILFFCCSDGSSVQKMLQSMLKTKAEETISYLKGIAKKDIDYNGVEVIMIEQFNFYRQILQKRMSVNDTLSAIKMVEGFLEEGWKALFNYIL